MLKNVYSVGQVNSYIKNMFSQDFLLRKVSVKGEVSNCKYHSSGHIYFTLKDATGTLSAIMFAGKRAGLSFKMKEGDKVVVTGSIEVYEKGGNYQIYAERIEQEGAGDLFLRFEALKRELEEMGMFDRSFKQPIPKYAKRIGIVTAPTGAAVRDIQNIAKRRNPYVQLILYPALVQGESAAKSICKGITCLDQMNLDIIILGRGGGSIEDLWAFNEEIVARAIFECRTPVISAVGHETDTTIADYVADLRAPTPSAAAEIAVFDYEAFCDMLGNYENRLKMTFEREFSSYRQKTELLLAKLRVLSPMHRMNENRKKLLDCEEHLQRAMLSKIEQKKHRYELLVQRLEALSPIKKLSMGYALVEDANQNKLSSIHQVKTEDSLRVYLKDGTITAKVLEVEEVER